MKGAKDEHYPDKFNRKTVRRARQSFWGVAKGVGLQNPLRELDNLENAAYTIAYY